MGDNAGFWIRLGANLLDELIVWLPLFLFFLILTNDGDTSRKICSFIVGLYMLLTPVFWKGYTIGKRICGIRIQKYHDESPPGLGTMLMRNLVAGIVYAFTFGIALIVSVFMVALREDKRSLHDLIAGTEIVYDY